MNKEANDKKLEIILSAREVKAVVVALAGMADPSAFGDENTKDTYAVVWDAYTKMRSDKAQERKK